MPKAKKEEKKGAVDPAKKAEAKKKTEEALKETESTSSEVEKESPEPKRAGRPDWYEDMKERTSRAHTYMRCFDATKKDVSSTCSIKKLDQIREASNQKLFEMSFLEEGTVKCHEKMMDDTEHESRKAKGQEYYERTMSRINRAKQKHSDLLDAIDKRKEAIERDPKQARKSSLIERFHEMRRSNPMLQLIRRVRLFETNPGYQEKATTWYGKAAEKVTGLKDAIMTDSVSEIVDTSMEVKSTSKDMKDNLEELKNAIDKKKGEDEPWDGVFDMVKDTAGVVKDTIFYVMNYDKRSTENNQEQMVGILTSSISVLADASEKIASLLSEYPFIGPIVGLIKNAITFFSEGYKFFKSRRRIRKLREQKTKLKERMLKRKKKYESDPELKGLYKYIGEGKDGEAKLDAGKLGKREYRGLRGGGSDARDEMKRAETSKAKKGKKRAYYAAKEQETIEQYDEIKEAIHKNKNNTKDAVIALVQNGIDVAANMAKLWPGTGTVVGAAIKVGSTLAGAGKSVGSKLVQLRRSTTGHRRSKANKEKFRSKYADHIYDHMAEVSEYLDSDGKIDLNQADPSRAKKVAESYDYAENMLAGMNADMADMVGAKSKDDLLDAMSGAFGAGD